MSWSDFRWALQALAERRVGAPVREAQRQEDATFDGAKKAARGVQ